MLFGKHINRYYLKYMPVLLLGLASLILVDYVQLLIPEIYKMVINGMNTGFVEHNGAVTPFDLDFLLDKICLPMIFIILSLVAGRFLWRMCFFGSAVKIEADIRDRMFDRCKELSQQYYQVNKVGNLMSLFTNDLETIEESFSSGIMMFFDALFLGALAIGKMFRMNIWLTLLALIPASLLMIMSLIIGKAMELKWDKRQEAFSSLSDFSQESFSGIAVIKAFVKESKELIAFRGLNSENEKANLAYVKISTLFKIMLTLFVESIVGIILGYGGYLVHEKVFNAGELIEFIGYFNAIVWPVMAVSELIEMTSRGKASLHRISELLDAKQDVRDADDVKEPAEIKGGIEFRNLTFRYPDSENDVLKNVSFTINAGENVGIVGKTGAGKTTIVDLMLRTYNVPDGTVFFDGNDVNSIPIHTVRNAAAYVPQDNFLFSDTIENNISFMPEGATHEQVETAAVNADIHDNIVSFTDGYKTVLGERGVTVSGGQKQRIAIARALVKDSAILILDDSVSAVDTATEKNILSNLKKLRAGRTTILIAHRITTIENMDKIIFIDDGKVKAVGSHGELYESCGEYRNMVDLQKLEDEEEKVNA